MLYLMHSKCAAWHEKNYLNVDLKMINFNYVVDV